MPTSMKTTSARGLWAGQLAVVFADEMTSGATREKL